MPLIPDLSRTCRTDDTFPPCSGTPVVRRKKGTTSFVWTIPLVWDLVAEPGSITLPPPFSKDRGDILAAIAGEGSAYNRKHHAQAEVELSMAVRVGQERVPVLDKATAVVRSIEVAASQDSGTVKALVAVEVPQTLAASMLDLFDADVDVSVVTDGELPFGEPQGRQVDDPDTDTDTDQEAEEPRQETLAQARARRRKAVEVEDLPPEPEDESADLDEVS